MQVITGQWHDYSKTVSRNKKDPNAEHYIYMGHGDKQTRINNFFKRYAATIYIGMCMRFSQTAARYTPPNIGKAYIDPKYYSRPIIKLDDLARGLVRTERGRRLYATREDLAALRAGFKFKVVNTKYRLARELKNVAVGYTKGINEAKRMARIENRGLSKYSWGSMLNNTKEDIIDEVNKGASFKDMIVFRAKILPPIFGRLARKSPNITKYNWGIYDAKFEPNVKSPNKMVVTVRNRLTEIQRYGLLAINRGIKAAMSYANAVWSKVPLMAENVGQAPGTELTDAQKKAELLRVQLAKIFDDDRQKYGVQQLTSIRGPQNFDVNKPFRVETNLPHT